MSLRGYWEKGALQAAVRRKTTAGCAPAILANSTPKGILRFRGRKKNVIVTPAGLNIYPEDLEAALRRQPAIRDAVVIP